ncbi:hypothetical protein [uncultured Pseudacidovorax sp.]|uniref:hypothetical protein n=1 Tax=uncultured Pseudacidovorax sp. TaxID=679313 RepID=UPI0025ECFE91|nr:hypothetical protein [uncultured Pseudacidovorax sp.]
MPNEEASPAPFTAHPGDLVFAAFALCALVVLGLAVQRTWTVATATEHSKTNAERLGHWLQQAVQGDDGVCPELADRGMPARWEGCLRTITAPEGPLAAMRNPFSGHAPQIVDRCRPGSTGTFGQLMLEAHAGPAATDAGRVAAAPAPGEVPPAAWTLRLQVCDGAGYPIPVQELAMRP